MKNKRETNPYTYKSLIEGFKKRKSISKGIFEFIVLIAPFLLTIITALDEDFNIRDLKNPFVYVFILLSLISVVVSLMFLKNQFFLGKDTHDVQIPKFLDYTTSASKHKFNEIFNSVYYNNMNPECDVLLYNGHDVIKNMLDKIKNLVHEITGIDLANISVNFIYRYQGEDEHWQTIDGTASCSIGTLDKIVDEGPSIYHHIYANNYEYVFFNKKADADWHIYSPSMRDGEDRKNWGSIYCRRILCAMYQERLVDGMIAISTYNERFCPSRLKSNIRRIEHILNDAVMAFQGLILIEMASLYGRHKYIRDKEMESLKRLSELLVQEPSCEQICQDISWLLRNGDVIVEERQRREYLKTLLAIFKEKYNNTHPKFFDIDNKLTMETITAIRYEHKTQNDK